MRPIPRYLGTGMLLVMAAIAAVGYWTIQRDVENLRVISQDNMLWSATQMEVELLRFELSTAVVAATGTPEAVDEMRERFDILWSRISLMSEGRVGDILSGYDEGHSATSAIMEYLHRIDPVVANLAPDDKGSIEAILRDLREFQRQLRLYTLRVVRGDTAAAAQVRDRIQASARTTAVISAVAVLICALALLLILRETRRQRMIAEMNRRAAEEAELASRAKSRFLTMMSHELRNPLNGVMGPLALLEQSGVAGRQKRLVDQANQSGRAMLRMLTGLLDFGELQDGCLTLRREPFRIAALAQGLRGSLTSAETGPVAIEVLPGGPELVYGDPDRLRQIFVNLVEYVQEARDGSEAKVTFSFVGGNLLGEISFGARADATNWKLDLLLGLNDAAPDQVSSDALRPMIARGLILAAKGVLTLVETGAGRVIRVAIPVERVEFDRIRVHLETRSSALAAIYQAALRSDRIVFAAPEDTGPVDLVLVDATSIGIDPLMDALHDRFPDALFVSLGLPQTPDYFDDIVEKPYDMNTLRSSVFRRLAS